MEGDPLASEVSLSVKLEQNGVVASAKSRTIVALDRLGGCVPELIAAFVERRTEKQRVKAEIEQRLLRARAEVAEQQLRGMPEAGAALLSEVFADEARKQINRGQVAIEAVDALLALPSASGSTPGEKPGERDEALNPDWMNHFTRGAEDASSEQIQQIWGRILAGEITKPGSFSRHALRFIAELDRKTAEHCELLASRTVADFIPRSDEWTEGAPLIAALDLQRLGLLDGVADSTGLGKTFQIGDRGLLGIRGRQFALVVHGVPGFSFNIGAMLLSRLGIEVFSLLERGDEQANLRSLARDHLQKPGITSVKLGPIRSSGDAKWGVDEVETVWESPDPA